MAALTATAQSALHPGPSWDETIVPTLRKRLEQESRMLANRLSQASLGDDDYPTSYYQHSSPATSPTHSPSFSQKPSAIPRPSLSQARPSAAELSSSAASSSRPANFKRPRTRSSPYILDDLPNGAPAKAPSPPPDQTRTGSPAVNGRPTRIPVSPRARSPSITSHFPPELTPTTPKANGYAMPGVSETASQSTVSIPGRQPNGSGILNEQPPFPMPSSGTSSVQPDQMSLRSSMDSEEHPYEHWYRGDYSRNGGVGELRVGRRMEMLEIASYGHSLRKMPERTSGRTSRADTEVTMGRSRRRAESFSARGSLYIDEDADAQHAAMVLDEQPLTDFEGDDFSSNSHAAISSPSLLSEERSASLRQQTPTPTPSRIPARRQQTEPPALNGTRNVSGTSAHASSSTTHLSSPGTPRARGSPSPTPSPGTPRARTASNANAKRRAKSPAASTPTSSAKKAKTKTPPPRRVREDEKRGSIAEYPIPKDGGDDMADAIPVWTQPKARGNWDEVVLPVVARKKGLHGLYEETDGNAPQRKPEEREPPPAPGTFGFDYSRYKPPRADLGAEDIPMEEFGQHRQSADHHGMGEGPPETSEVNLDEDEERERRRMRLNPPRPPESPVPFARYHSPNPEMMSASGHGHGMVVQVPVDRREDEKRRQQEEEEEGGGCCKCVIM